MSDQFIFFCVNLGNEKLLKEEIRVFYPDFTLSYSRKGFITYKNKGIHYNQETITQVELAFCTRAGICLGKTSPINLIKDLAVFCESQNLLLSDCSLHSYSINTLFELIDEGLDNYQVNTPTKEDEIVLNLITLGEKEIWIGLHRVTNKITKYPNSNPEVIVPSSAPSIGYKKIAEAVKLFHFNIRKTDLWLDFGAAPGGASHFLLNEGCKVWGIDPAIISKTLTQNSRFKHIKKSVQDLSQEELPDLEINWVYADININPKQAIKEVLRLIKKYNFSLKGIIFTIQIIKEEHIKNIEILEEQFYDWGFSKISSRQIPSHKSEYVIIARK